MESWASSASDNPLSGNPCFSLITFSNAYKLHNHSSLTYFIRFWILSSLVSCCFSTSEFFLQIHCTYVMYVVTDSCLLAVLQFYLFIYYYYSYSTDSLIRNKSRAFDMTSFVCCCHAKINLINVLVLDISQISYFLQ